MKHKRGIKRAIQAIAGLIVLVPLPASAAEDMSQADGSPVAGASDATTPDLSIPSAMRDCAFADRDNFIGLVAVRHARLAIAIDRLRARHVEAMAGPAKKAAMAELASAESGFEQKLDEIESASVETWEAARDNVAASWDDLRTAYVQAVEAR